MVIVNDLVPFLMDSESMISGLCPPWILGARVIGGILHHCLLLRSMCVSGGRCRCRCDRQYYVPLLILHLHARSLALDTRPLLNSSGSATGRVEIIIGRVMLHEGLLELIEMAVSCRIVPPDAEYYALFCGILFLSPLQLEILFR